MSLARRMQRNLPLSRWEVPSASIASDLDEHRDVVRVARHDVDEPVLAPHQGLIVDAPGVHLPEPEFGALRQEPERPVGSW